MLFAMQTEGRGAGRDDSGSNFHDESRLEENYMQQALPRVVLNCERPILASLLDCHRLPLLNSN